jgi:predicted peptidase
MIFSAIQSIFFTKAFFLLAVVLLGSSCANDFFGFERAKFLAREVEIGSNNYGYRVFVPKVRPPGQKLPVMLFLHGSDERGDDNEAQVKGFEKIIGDDPQKFGFIIVFPQCRPGKFWAGEMTAQAMLALDRTVAEFGGDENRLYLSGFSLGGFGVWQTAILYPQKFAALVPLSGRVLPRLDKNSKERAALLPEQLALDESPEPYQAIAERIGKTPVWVFHGKNDTIVPIGQSRKIVEAFRKAGNSEINVTEYEDTGHLTIGRAFGEPALFEWLAKQKLELTKTE